MKKLQFKKGDSKIQYGIPKKIKLLVTGAAIVSTTLASVSCEESDDCSTTSTDITNPDLGAQQDPNTVCDSD